MGRILVESARRKESLKRGGGLVRADLDGGQILAPEIHEDIVALDQALTKLAATDKSLPWVRPTRQTVGAPTSPRAAA